MAEKLTDEELITRIKGEITDSLGYMAVSYTHLTLPTILLV